MELEPGLSMGTGGGGEGCVDGGSRGRGPAGECDSLGAEQLSANL